MERYVWLFPILFIFHDMEEIIGLGIWLKKNQVILTEKYPMIGKMYQNYSTEGMAVAVLEEFLVAVLFCLLGIVSQNRACWLLWLGVFAAYAFHLLIHIAQTVILRTYIPALLTSLIAFPISVWIMICVESVLRYSIGELIIFGMLGLVIVGVNLKAAHFLLHRFTIWMKAVQMNEKV